jgi:hypothetical protein
MKSGQCNFVKTEYEPDASYDFMTVSMVKVWDVSTTRRTKTIKEITYAKRAKASIGPNAVFPLEEGGSII